VKYTVGSFNDMYSDVLSKYTQNKSIINIGAGIYNERAAYVLHKKFIKNSLNKSVIAIEPYNDINNEEITNDLKYDFKVINKRIEKLNLKDKFDIVFSSEVIEHISNQESFIQKCKSFMKEDGLMIHTTPNSTNIENFTRILKNNKDPRQDRFHSKVSDVYVSGHVVIHNISTLQQLFYENNLDIIAVYYSAFKGMLFGRFFFRKLMIKLRPYFGRQIIVVAKKTA